MKVNNSPTLRRIDTEDVTPDRLKGEIDFSVFDELVDFSHRGSRCKVERLISYLCASIENYGINKGDLPKPSNLSEFEAVDTVIDALESKYPAWFGDKEALEEVQTPTSDTHLLKSNLENIYYNDQLVVQHEDVDSDDWGDITRIVIPVLAIALDQVRGQIRADASAGQEEGMHQIKRCIIKEALENDLSEEDIDIAIDAAKQILDQNKRTQHSFHQ